MTRKFLENYCREFGPGLDRKFLSDLRDCLAVEGVEERRLSDGYSYFPFGSGALGRILKIVDWGRLFLEFNIHINVSKTGAKKEDIVWLNESLRYELHAGGVIFCYVGRNKDVSITLVKAALEESLGLSYENLHKKAVREVKTKRRIEKVSILIRTADKDGKEQLLLKGFCKKYGLEFVPIYNFNDLFSTEAPKTIIALSFNDKQWQSLPAGFIPIPLKELGGRLKDLVSFDEVKDIAREYFYMKKGAVISTAPPKR